MDLMLKNSNAALDAVGAGAVAGDVEATDAGFAGVAANAGAGGGRAVLGDTAFYVYWVFGAGTDYVEAIWRAQLVWL